ncbi:peroxidase 41-like [Telopea speciosissima]|uniref:peroxidase 41-like n=1 Tax=Telopea speciosissima TaxID=54955 RepID=UPI001CC73E90|nr:peroxidase 41-like [Telopea speciosissima]
MAKTTCSIMPLSFFFLFILSFKVAASSTSTSSKEEISLSYDFYKTSCPNVERIIHNVASQKLLEAPTTAAGALRLFFHDCFVEGCDASVLIASTKNKKAERDAEINLSLPGDGFDMFFRAKRALELQCPGVVSCADVMAIATRDLVSLVGGPRWAVEKGRKDGLVSRASRVAGNLPEVNQTISQLISLFKSKGLNVLEMVSLSGGHTIGFSHCKEFMSRIYAFNKTYGIDPTMDQNYAKSLQSPCPKSNPDPTVVAFNDVTTPIVFDNVYYQNLQKGLGLLATDQKLFIDPMTRSYVNLMAKDQQVFFNYFVASMIKLGRIGVKTGSDGEVRRDCGFFNG